jgi:hypothetical protein
MLRKVVASVAAVTAEPDCRKTRNRGPRVCNALQIVASPH